MSYDILIIRPYQVGLLEHLTRYQKHVIDKSYLFASEILIHATHIQAIQPTIRPIKIEKSFKNVHVGTRVVE